MAHLIIFLCVVTSGVGLCKPTEKFENDKSVVQPHPPINPEHHLWKRFANPDLAFGGFSDSGMTRKRTKRFINPALTMGDFSDTGVAKIRTRRSYEECEKLSLCKLHAQSQRNFFSAFELYFVNKENARLWDHRARSVADCQRKFSGCYK